MRKYFIWGGVLLALVIFGVFYLWDMEEKIVLDGKVERFFLENVVSGGDILEVSLDIELDEGQTYYLFEEVVPEGFVVLDNISKGNSIKIIEIMNAKSHVFSYRVRVPEEEGVYVFSGEYGMKGIDGVVEIEGDNEVRVVN